MIDQPFSNPSCYHCGKIFLKHCPPRPSSAPESTVHPLYLQSGICTFPSTASTAGHAHHCSSTPAPSSLPHPGHGASWLLQHPLNSSHVCDGTHSSTITLLHSPKCPEHPVTHPPGTDMVWLNNCRPLCWLRSDSFGQRILGMYQGFSTSAPLAGLDNTEREDASSVHCRF